MKYLNVRFLHKTNFCFIVTFISLSYHLNDFLWTHPFPSAFICFQVYTFIKKKKLTTMNTDKIVILFIFFILFNILFLPKYHYHKFFDHPLKSGMLFLSHLNDGRDSWIYLILFIPTPILKSISHQIILLFTLINRFIFESFKLP